MKITSRILLFCSIFFCLSYTALSQMFTGCPACATNVIPFAGHGPASGTDPRRVVNVRIDETWGANTPTNIWNATCAGQPGIGCAGATGPSALGMWNSVGTYYFFQLNQDDRTQQTQTDILITRDATWPANMSDACAYTVTPGENPRTGQAPWITRRVIHLPPGSENWSQQQLACVIAHEMGHTMGLTDIYAINGCNQNSIMNQNNGGDCSQGCNRTQITSDDVQAANQNAADRTKCNVVGVPVQRLDGGGPVTDPEPYHYNPTCYYVYESADYYRRCECAESGCQCASGYYTGLKYLGTEYYLVDYFCY